MRTPEHRRPLERAVRNPRATAAPEPYRKGMEIGAIARKAWEKRTMKTTTALRIEALPAEELARIRSRCADDFGNPVIVTVEEGQGGSPLRCCLREARNGERIALIAYRPSRIESPYSEVGPVFIHADACEGYAEPDRYPEDFRRRRQLLRAYSAGGRIVDAEIGENGDAAEALCAAFFQRPEIAYIHSRNVLWGCYMFTIRRPA